MVILGFKRLVFRYNNLSSLGRKQNKWPENVSLSFRFRFDLFRLCAHLLNFQAKTLWIFVKK